MYKPRFFNNDDMHREQAELCVKFFKGLSKLLREQGDYQTMGTGKCPKNFFVEGKDKGIFRLNDHYLFPYGTKKQITYYGKPYWSFRISDHWNWYEQTKKCAQEQFIQCFNVDLPIITKRFVENNQRSTAVAAMQVAIYKNHDDEAYHCVYGAYKDKNTHEWCWMEKTPEEVVNEYALI